jgi:hypothetical protein
MHHLSFRVVDAGSFIHYQLGMDYGAIATVVLAVVAVSGVIYGAGRMSNAIQNMADAISMLVKKIESLFELANAQSRTIDVHEQRLNQNDARLIKLER